ncbi:MAG: NAD-dependent epimerase/dehydratase family protein [Patescibacteria group bacterium]
MLRTVIVTGGAGFIGSHIVDALVERGFGVWVVDNLSTGKRSNVNTKAKFIRLDIRNPRLKRIFLKIKPLFVFHCAAQMDVKRSLREPHYDAEVNIIGSLNVIKCAADVGVKKFIFTSTGGAVYGDTKVIPTPETEPEMPISPYGVAKLAVDKYLHQYWRVKGMPYVSLRFSNVYGPRQRADGEAGVVAIFAGRMVRGLPCAINGSGKQTRDFVYVGDVVDAAMKAMQKPFIGVVNIATGKESSVNQVYAHLSKLLDSQLKAQHSFAIKGEQMRSVLDWRKAEKALGWMPRVRLEEGLRRTVEWHYLNVKSKIQKSK